MNYQERMLITIVKNKGACMGLERLSSKETCNLCPYSIRVLVGCYMTARPERYLEAIKLLINNYNYTQGDIVEILL